MIGRACHPLDTTLLPLESRPLDSYKHSTLSRMKSAMGNRITTVTIRTIIFIATISCIAVLIHDAHAQTRGTRPRSVTSPAPKPSEAEQLLWQEALRRDTRDAYDFYLREFPNGAYITQAKSKIVEIETRTERTNWDAAIASNTKASFESYIIKYPSGRFVSQANERIKQFNRAEEDASWKSAEEQKSADAYTDYLRKYPSGLYASIARLRLSSMGFFFRPPKGSVGSVITNSVGMQFSWIPPGSFLIGSTETEAADQLSECRKTWPKCPTYWFYNETPQRFITIKTGFWMGRFEVTQGQYEAVMGTNPSDFKECGRDCPVESIYWKDAKEFIDKLNARNDGLVYSLPSEAEWEYAARAGNTDNQQASLDEVAWYADNAGDKKVDGYKLWMQDSEPKWDLYIKGLRENGNRTRKVGLKNPNAWGLHDMLGNVEEWTEDKYQEDYKQIATDGSANTNVWTGGGIDNARGQRGGSWASRSQFVRSNSRVFGLLGAAENTTGFRVVARPRPISIF